MSSYFDEQYGGDGSDHDDNDSVKSSSASDSDNEDTGANNNDNDNEDTGANDNENDNDDDDADVVGVSSDDDDDDDDDDEAGEATGNDEDEDEDNNYSDDDSDAGTKKPKAIPTKTKSTFASSAATAISTGTDINDDDDDDDDEDPDGEDYLQKFNRTIGEDYILKCHPESISHNYDEVLAMAKVVRDGDGIIIDKLHRTIPFLTKYEKARILGQRAKQIDSGATPFVTVPENVIDGYIIATMELQQKRIPFIIRRPLPNGGCEYWRVSDLEDILF